MRTLMSPSGVIMSTINVSPFTNGLAFFILFLPILLLKVDGSLIQVLVLMKKWTLSLTQPYKISL